MYLNRLGIIYCCTKFSTTNNIKLYLSNFQLKLLSFTFLARSVGTQVLMLKPKVNKTYPLSIGTFFSFFLGPRLGLSIQYVFGVVIETMGIEDKAKLLLFMLE